MSVDYKILSDSIEVSLRALPKTIPLLPNAVINVERLENAKKYYEESTSMVIPENSSPREKYKYETRRIKLLLCALVEIDTILHSDLDPVIGALDIQDAESSPGILDHLIIDSPFLRFVYYNGFLKEVYYKPRKIIVFENAFNPLDFVSSKKLPTILTRSQDMIILQTEGFSDSGLGFTCNYSIRSGIGGYGPSSTTGFSIDYWIDANNRDITSNLITLETSIVLPSAELGGFSYRPLLIAGGVSEHSEFFSKKNTISSEDISSGLFGVRFIDGINNLVIDIRSIQALEEIYFEPQVIEDGNSEFVPRTILKFKQKSSSCCSIDKPSKIYLTIY